MIWFTLAIIIYVNGSALKTSHLWRSKTMLLIPNLRMWSKIHMLQTSHVYQLQIKSPIRICNTSFIPICESKILIREIQAELIHVTKISIFGTTPPTIRWILHEVSRFSSYVIVACGCQFPQSSASFIARQWSTGTCCLRYETHVLFLMYKLWTIIKVAKKYWSRFIAPIDTPPIYSLGRGFSNNQCL